MALSIVKTALRFDTASKRPPDEMKKIEQQRRPAS